MVVYLMYSVYSTVYVILKGNVPENTKTFFSYFDVWCDKNGVKEDDTIKFECDLSFIELLANDAFVQALYNIGVKEFKWVE